MNLRILKRVFWIPLVIVGLILLYFASRPQSRAIYQQKEASEILMLGAFKLQQYFISGALEDDWQKGCSKYWGKMDNIDTEYLKCNPLFIDCLFAENQLEVEFRKKKYKIHARLWDQSYSFPVSRAIHGGKEIPRFAYLVELYLPAKSEIRLPILLEDQCREVLLPERKYAYGKYEKNKTDWHWDNSSQEIYIDKFPVSLLQLSQWKKALPDKTKHIRIPNKAIDLSKPATELTPQQMEQFCAFQGKEILQAHILDAASFHPGDEANLFPISMPRGAYPNGRKEQDFFLFHAQNNRNFRFKPEYCEQVYTRECLEYRWAKSYHRGSTSWIGIFNVLGGYPEYLQNPIEPEKNIRISSFYFPAKSNWHQLGLRGSRSDLPENIKLSFRCMRRGKNVD